MARESFRPSVASVPCQHRVDAVQQNACCCAAIVSRLDSKTPPYPSVGITQCRRCFAHAKVAAPSPQVGRQLFHNLLKTAPPTALRNLPDSLLHSGQGLRRDAPLRSFPVRKAKAKELTMQRPAHGTLLCMTLSLSLRNRNCSTLAITRSPARRLR